MLKPLFDLLRTFATRRPAADLWSCAEAALSEREREARLSSFGRHWASTGLEMPERVEDAYALFHATRDASGMNRALRGERPTPARLALARLTAGALRRLAPREGLCHRGTRMPVAVLELAQPGRLVADPGFLCATLDPVLAEERVQRALLPGEARVRMTIHGRSGRFMGTSEAQVMFLPRTAFRVCERTQDADGVVHLTLVEA